MADQIQLMLVAKMKTAAARFKELYGEYISIGDSSYQYYGVDDKTGMMQFKNLSTGKIVSKDPVQMLTGASSQSLAPTGYTQTATGWAPTGTGTGQGTSPFSTIMSTTQTGMQAYSSIKQISATSNKDLAAVANRLNPKDPSSDFWNMKWDPNKNSFYITDAKGTQTFFNITKLPNYQDLKASFESVAMKYGFKGDRTLDGFINDAKLQSLTEIQSINNISSSIDQQTRQITELQTHLDLGLENPGIFKDLRGELSSLGWNSSNPMTGDALKSFLNSKYTEVSRRLDDALDLYAVGAIDANELQNLKNQITRIDQIGTQAQFITPETQADITKKIANQSFDVKVKQEQLKGMQEGQPINEAARQEFLTQQTDLYNKAHTAGLLDENGMAYTAIDKNHNTWNLTAAVDENGEAMYRNFETGEMKSASKLKPDVRKILPLEDSVMGRTIRAENEAAWASARNDFYKGGLVTAGAALGMWGSVKGLFSGSTAGKIGGALGALGSFGGLVGGLKMINSALLDPNSSLHLFLPKWIGGDYVQKGMKWLSANQYRGAAMIGGAMAAIAIFQWWKNRKSEEEVALQDMNEEIAPVAWYNGPVMMITAGLALSSMGINLGPSAPAMQELVAPDISLMLTGSATVSDNPYGTVYVQQGDANNPTRIIYLSRVSTGSDGKAIEKAQVLTLKPGMTFKNPGSNAYIPIFIKDSSGKLIPNPKAVTSMQATTAMLSGAGSAGSTASAQAAVTAASVQTKDG